LAKILPFPGPRVRAEIHAAIQSHAVGRLSRQEIVTFVAGRLSEYGLRKLNVNSYTVKVIDPIPAVLGIWPVILIQARGITEEPCCPVCRSKACGYLGGREVITIACRGCGAIYEYKGVSAGEKPGNAG